MSVTLPYSFGSLGTTNGKFQCPMGITVYNSEIYVVDSGNNRVQVFNLDGVFQRKWGNSSVFSDPVSIACLGTELYVLETTGCRVQVFDSEGGYKRKWGSYGTENGQFRLPTNICTDGAYLYIADRSNGRVQKFTPAGVFQAAWVLDTYGLTLPNTIAASFSEIFVGTPGYSTSGYDHEDRVWVLNSGGIVQRVWGPGGYQGSPYALLWYGDKIYYGCYGVSIFQPDGTYISFVPDTTPSSPYRFGIAVANSICYMSDPYYHRILLSRAYDTYAGVLVCLNNITLTSIINTLEVQAILSKSLEDIILSSITYFPGEEGSLFVALDNITSTASASIAFEVDAAIHLADTTLISNPVITIDASFAPVTATGKIPNITAHGVPGEYFIEGIAFDPETGLGIPGVLVYLFDKSIDELLGWDIADDIGYFCMLLAIKPTVGRLYLHGAPTSAVHDNLEEFGTFYPCVHTPRMYIYEAVEA